MSDTKDRNLDDDDQAQARLPHLMRIDEVAEHLGVSVRHVRRLVQERRIPFLNWAISSCSTTRRSPAGSSSSATRRK